MPSGTLHVAEWRMHRVMRSILTSALLVISAYQAWDFYHLATKSSNSHALAEAVVGAAGVAVMACLLIRERRRRTLSKLRAVAARSKARQRAMIERDESAIQVTRNFLQAMRIQFERWKLTPSEMDVATLLMKGLSVEECALALQCSDAAVRELVASLYNKAGLVSRHQLLGYFWGDLLGEPKITVPPLPQK